MTITCFLINNNFYNDSYLKSSLFFEMLTNTFSFFLMKLYERVQHNGLYMKQFSFSENITLKRWNQRSKFHYDFRFLNITL